MVWKAIKCINLTPHKTISAFYKPIAVCKALISNSGGPLLESLAMAEQRICELPSFMRDDR